MRQAIRVYASVALAVLGALLAVWWRLPRGVVPQLGWPAALDLVMAAQLWVLLVIPLGVLAASDAAHTSRRGWLAIFGVLLALVTVAAWYEPLVTGMDLNSIDPACVVGFCGRESSGPENLYLAMWTVVFLPVPLAALIYTLAPGHGPPHVGTAATRGERRVIVVCAAIGVVVMGVLGYQESSEIIFTLFASGSAVAHYPFISDLYGLLQEVWLLLLDPLPVAVASLALAHAARVGQRGWLAGWIALIALTMVMTNLFNLVATALMVSGSARVRGLLDFQPQMGAIGAVVPVVVMLVALLYALTMRPSQSQEAALAT